MDIPQLYDIFKKHPVITSDTRNCLKGSIFFALRGASFNGNDFAQQALDKGCAFAVVDDSSVEGDERIIHVDDALRTMQDLATYHRRQFSIPVIEVTGTNGKTTTKELMAAVLGKKYDVLYTEANYNNHIGVPKTLLRLNKNHDIAIIETGANHPGEIKTLANIVEPTCGIITNVGKAHLEGFGSFEGVIHTKGELYDYLRNRKDSFIFLHADNQYLMPIAHGLKAFTYGAPGKGYDVEGETICCNPYLKMKWRRNGGEWHEVQMQLIGAYNVFNALAAASAGIKFGVDEQDISRALSEYKPTNNRSELLKTERNELIVDAYNANPTSMKAALENFALMQSPQKMAVLGEMRELGESSAEEHRQVVAEAERTGCKEIWLVGENFRPYAGSHRFFANESEVEKALSANPLTGRLILIKGSNGTKLFKLPALL